MYTLERVTTKESIIKLMTDPAFDGKGKMEFYDLMSLQGQGAFGKVWKARHRLTGHLVAIKIYDPIKMKDQSLKALLMNEIKAMKRVSHKHSMQFLESFQHHNKVSYDQTYCVFLIYRSSPHYHVISLNVSCFTPLKFPGIYLNILGVPSKAPSGT
jgi:serine/threonine protein kinase